MTVSTQLIAHKFKLALKFLRQTVVMALTKMAQDQKASNTYNDKAIQRQIWRIQNWRRYQQNNGFTLNIERKRWVYISDGKSNML